MLKVTIDKDPAGGPKVTIYKVQYGFHAECSILFARTSQLYAVCFEENSHDTLEMCL